MRSTKADDLDGDLDCGPPRATLRPRRLIDEPIESTLVESLEPLVAGLSADAELAAQLPERHLLRQCLQNKVFSQLHD